MNDYLLENFSDNQKELIIKELYPSLKQAMMHFVLYSEQNEFFIRKIQNEQDISQADYLNNSEIEEINNI